MISNNKTSHFEIIQTLQPKFANEFSNQVLISRKSPNDTTNVTMPLPAKYQYRWFQKTMLNYKSAIFEVIAQELFRLYIPGHPKTRVKSDNDNNYYVMSKEILNFKSLESHSLEDTQLLKENISKGVYKNLGKIQIMSLWLNEIDFRKPNLGTDNQQRLIKIDGGWCFARMKRYSDAAMSAPFNMSDIQSLPFVTTYKAYNWLDIIYQYQSYYQKTNASERMIHENLHNETYYLNEIYVTALNILLTPCHLLRHFINHYTDDNYLQAMIYNELMQRKQMLLEAMVGNNEFKNYLEASEAALQVEEFIKSIDSFMLTEKTSLKNICPNAAELIKTNFTVIKANLDTLNNQQMTQMFCQSYAYQFPIAVNPEKNDPSISVHIINDSMAPFNMLLSNPKTDINQSNKHGETALFTASVTNRIEYAKKLLGKKADPNRGNNSLDTPLIAASKCGYVKMVELLVTCNDINIDQEDDNGMTAFMWACRYGHVEIAKLLVAKKSDINHQNKDGNSALMLACRSGMKDIVDLLLNAGAKITLTNNVKDNAINIAENWLQHNLATQLKKATTTLEFPQQETADKSSDQQMKMAFF